jgi:hypothetical protein
MPILVIRWCGETGETKEDLCTEIVGIMERAGIHHRKNVNVRSKIHSLIADYKKARDWLDSTGPRIAGDGAEQRTRGRRTRPSASVLFR